MSKMTPHDLLHDVQSDREARVRHAEEMARLGRREFFLYGFVIGFFSACIVFLLIQASH